MAPRRPLLAAFLACAALRAPAADINPGGFLGLDGGSAGVPAFSFLKLPVSARSIGLSSRTLTTDEQASLVHGNPAALGLVADYSYSLSHAEILGEFRHEDMAMALPTRRHGGFGLGATLLSATAFEDARDIDENPAYPTAYDAALGLAYGRTLLGGRLAAGARLDLLRSSIDGTTAHGYAVGLGSLFFLVHDWRLGAAVHNLSHGVRYGRGFLGDGPLEPLPLGAGVELGKPMLGSRWSAHAGFGHGNEGILRWYGGGEFRIWRYLLLRMGWDGSSQDRELGGFGGLAAGTGLEYERLTLDYGFKTLGLLGAYHAVTLNFSRKATFRPPDEALLEKALALQRKGRYGQALARARKAVAANPYNFKAQALARQLQTEMDRLDETAFSLHFTGGTAGHLTSHWLGGRPLGGLARRKTKLVELRGLPGKSLVLDAGGLTHPASGREEADYVHAAYAQMPYDAVNLGAEELALGAARLGRGIPWLSSRDVRPPPRGLAARKTLSLKGGTEVVVLGSLEGASPADGAGASLEATAGLARRAAAGSGRRLLVLLFHGTLAAARTVAEAAPELDVIVVGGETRALGSPMLVGTTYICSPGRGGTHVGSLTLTLDKEGGIRSFRHALLPLDASIPEDEGIRRLLAPVTIDPNRFAIDDYDEDYRAQVFAYVRSDRPGTGGRLRLRDLRGGGDFPVPAASPYASRPILGYGKNRIAYLGADSPDGPRQVYAVELGSGRVDTLTSGVGSALDIRWILGNNALLAAWGEEGARDLYRIDPWSRETRNLGGGRFGDVQGFDATRSGDRLAVLGAADGRATLWVTSLSLEEPLAVASDKGFLGPPRWNAKGDRLAFIVRGEDGAAAGELRVFDFREKRLVPVTLKSRVRDFAWSADGARIYYVAGVNLLDINEYHLDSLVVRKATLGGPATRGGPASPGDAGYEGPEGEPRSEEAPAPKVVDGRDGLLFEAATEGSRRIHWLDLGTREERVLVDSAGCNSLR